MSPILDGYTRHAVIGKLNVHYRPATRRERDQFAYMGRTLGDEIGKEAVFHFVAGHLVSSDLGVETSIDHLRALNETRPAVFDQMFLAIQGQIPDPNGKRWIDVEMACQMNLYSGIVFELSNPSLASRSCEDCQRLWYNEATGKPILVSSTGLPMLRDGPTACRTELGCPKGTPEKQKTLSKENRWAFSHFRECEAVCCFPPDPIVRQNAIVIRRALAQVERLKKKAA